MSEGDVDFRAVFQALPSMVALLTPDFVIVDVNRQYELGSGRGRERLVGRPILEEFPDPPHEPEASGVGNLEASLRRVLATRQRDTMAIQRYDVESATQPGHWEMRYWSPVNIPVIDDENNVVLIIHRVEEVTELLRLRERPDESRKTFLQAELLLRSRELDEVNKRLRQAHAHERDVAMSLQRAMLPAPQAVGHHRAAVRYQPATDALNVCGDWYDLVDLPGDSMAAAVGDVVGHGLVAAGIMGQLRSALSAASRVAGPAQALEVLSRYARSIEGAESTTAVKTHISWDRHAITYSSAGHPPPALLRADGTVDFLDQATDPPLAARPVPMHRPEATVSFAEGDTLVLYTDGLIERRREDIDVGLARLAEALSRHRTASPEELADAVLGDLLPPEGATDDTALVVIRL